MGPLGRTLAFAIAGTLLTSTVHAQEAPSPDAPAPDVSAAPEAADPKNDPEAANQHFARARQLYEESDFALALVEFQRAYDLSPNYRVLYNIGQVNIQLFNYAAARLALEKYLEDGGPDISAARRSQVEADVKMLRDRTAYVSIVSVPGGAEVSIDDVPVGKAPFEEPRLVNAGQRRIAVTHAGYVPAMRLVTLAGGDRTDLKFELVPVPVASVVSNEPVILVPRTTTQKNYTPALIGWVATGALTISAAVVGGLYLSKESEIETLSKPESAVSPQGKNDAETSATRLAVAADILGVAAIGAGIASLYFTLRPPRTETVLAPTTGKIRIVPAFGGVAGTF